MVDIPSRVTELALERNCCSQIIMRIGLEMKGRENPDLIQAVKGMCNGFYTQRLCGTLSAAACLLSLYNEHYAPVLIPELFKWFEGRFGSVNCTDLIGSGKRDMQKCFEITSETCSYCFELLEKNGLLTED